MVGDALPGRTVIGCNNIIGHHAVVGIKCQDMKYKVTYLLHLLMHNQIWLLMARSIMDVHCVR